MNPTTGLAPSTRMLLTLAAAVVTLAGVHMASGVLAPVLLAVVIVIIVHPLRHPLEARGWPRWVATTAVIAAAYLILAILVAMLAFAGVRFGALVRDYLSDLQAAADDVNSWITSLGFEGSIGDQVASWLEPSRLLSLVSSISGTVLAVASAFFFVLAYVIFMAVDAARYDGARKRFGATRKSPLDRANGFNSGVRRYFVVNATFGAIVAVIDGVALWIIGVPAPIVWAILAFVTNFIPNIGFVLGMIPPTVLAFVVGGWQLSLAVIAIYCIVNVVLQVLVQPKFVSDAVNLTLTLSFVSVVFWTFVIGPLGAILAVPLTLLLRAFLLEGSPDTHWLRWLSGDPVPGGEGDEDPPSDDATEDAPDGEPAAATEPEPDLGTTSDDAPDVVPDKA